MRVQAKPARKAPAKAAVKPEAVPKPEAALASQPSASVRYTPHESWNDALRLQAQPCAEQHEASFSHQAPADALAISAALDLLQADQASPVQCCFIHTKHARQAGTG